MTSLSGHRAQSLLRWSVLPHYQRTGCPFLRLSVAAAFTFGLWSLFSLHPFSAQSQHVALLVHWRVVGPQASWWTRPWCRRLTSKSSDHVTLDSALRAPPSWREWSLRTPFAKRTVGSAFFPAVGDDAWPGDFRRCPSVDRHSAWLLLYKCINNKAVIGPPGQYIDVHVWGEGDDAGVPLLVPALTLFLRPGASSHAASACSPFGGYRCSRAASILVVRCRRCPSAVRGLPAGAPVTSHSFACGPAAAYADSSYWTWVRVSCSDLLPPIMRHCFTYQFRTPSMNVWAATVWMKSTGSPTRARCACSNINHRL
jgi:hypothetical protein